MYYGTHNDWIKENLKYSGTKTATQTFLSAMSLIASSLNSYLSLIVGLTTIGSAMLGDGYEEMLDQSMQNSSVYTNSNYSVIYSITDYYTDSYIYTYGGGWK